MLTSTEITSARDAERELWREHGLHITERFIDIAEPRLRVRVLECGNRSGPPLVFVQGGLGEAWGWAPLLARLRDFRCITLDRPGGGLSDTVDFLRVDVRKLARDVLAATLDAAGLDRAPFVANSMGGWWTFQLALAAPARVSRMVMIGCPALLPKTGAPFSMRLLSIPVAGHALSKVMVPPSAAKTRGLPSILGHPREVGAHWSDAQAEVVYRFANLSTFRDAWYTLARRFLRPWGSNPGMRITPEELRRISQPTLFLWGQHDPFGGLDAGRAAAALMPAGRLEVLGVGHLPWWDDPDAAANHIRQFVMAGQAASASKS